MDFHHSPRMQAVGLLAGLAVAAAALAADADDYTKADKKWIKGPVSYLATDDEAKSFKKQKSAADREAFIAEFWSRRDPSPDTEDNPFRDRFYQRVADTNAALEERGVVAGWKSDPGRVLILLGPPAAMRTEAADAGIAAASSGSTSGPNRFGESTFSGDTSSIQGGSQAGGGKLILTYENLEDLGLPAELEVEFQQEGLSYRLLSRLDLTGDAVRGLDRDLLVKQFPVGEEPVTEEKISLAEAKPKAADAAGSVQQELLLAVLDAGTAEEPAIPFAASVDYYKALGTQTYVAITIGLPLAELDAQGLPLDDLHPVAALRDVDDPQNIFLYDSDSLFAPSDAALEPAEDGLLRFQAGDGVKPGEYVLAMGVVNADGSLSGVLAETVKVPDFSSGIQISSITLAQQLEETDLEASDLKRPYILGNRKVVPRVNSDYEPDGNLVMYYQVYNADTGGGAPNLRISYNFYQKRGTRYVKRGTAPPQDGVQEQVQIYELPLQGWPKGEYKLKVTVTDNATGAFAEREVPFQVG